MDKEKFFEKIGYLLNEAKSEEQKKVIIDNLSKQIEDDEVVDKLSELKACITEEDSEDKNLILMELVYLLDEGYFSRKETKK